MEKLLNNKELEEYLQLSADAIRNCRRRKVNPLPYVISGSKGYRYRPSEVDRWLQRNTEIHKAKEKTFGGV